jgi:hypothetical protein
LKESNLIYLILRIALAGTFIGHGYFAFTQKPSWINYLITVGFSLEVSLILMKVIGLIDLFIAVLALFKPFKYLFYYALLWTFLTALIRPLSGEHFMEFVERFSNMAVPLALIIVSKKKPQILGFFNLLFYNSISRELSSFFGNT